MNEEPLNRDTIDGTEMAKNIIQCVSQVQFPCGVTHIATILAGKRWKSVLMYGHENLPCFGLGSEYSVDQWSVWIHELVANGYLSRSSGYYPVICLTDTSHLILDNMSGVELSKPINKKIPQLSTPYDKALYNLLKSKRLEIAQLKDYPAYVIFHDTMLAEMCRRYPCTIDQLKSIKGIGDKKAEQYGEYFLSIIRQYMNDNNITQGEKYYSTEERQESEQVQNSPDAQNDLFTNAYDLQKYISSLNKEINDAKKVLSNIYKEIKASGIQQNDMYRLVCKEQSIRIVDPAKFFQAYPNEFVQYAKIPVSKAELVTGPEEIDKYITKTVRESYRIEKLD